MSTGCLHSDLCFCLFLPDHFHPRISTDALLVPSMSSLQRGSGFLDLPFLPNCPFSHPATIHLLEPQCCCVHCVYYSEQVLLQSTSAKPSTEWKSLAACQSNDWLGDGLTSGPQLNPQLCITMLFTTHCPLSDRLARSSNRPQWKSWWAWNGRSMDSLTSASWVRCTSSTWSASARAVSTGPSSSVTPTARILAIIPSWNRKHYR